MKIIQLQEWNGWLVGLDADGMLYQYVYKHNYNETTKMDEYNMVGWKPMPTSVLHEEWVK